MQIEIREKAAKVLKLYKYGMRNIIFPYINNILKKLTNIDNDKDILKFYLCWVKNGFVECIQKNY